MIKIEKQSDLKKLDNKQVHPIINNYIKKYFLCLCKQYKSTDLSQVGAIFFAEHKEDLLLHTELGLSVPIEQSVFEFADLLTLQSKTKNIKLWHCCFVLTNDNAVSLFIPADILVFTKFESCLLQDYTQRKVYIENV